MVVLTELNNNASIMSGVIAAVISGIVSIIGSFITIHFQNKRNEESLKVQEENSRESLKIQKENNEASIKMQKEIANFQKDEKIFYENQLKWANDIREHLSKIILLIEKYNDEFMTVLTLDRMIYSDSDPNKYIKLQESALDKNIKIGHELLEQVSVVRMLLFNDNDSYELEIEDRLNEIQQWIIQRDTIKVESVEYLIIAAKKYFNNQMKQLEKKML